MSNTNVLSRFFLTSTRKTRPLDGNIPKGTSDEDKTTFSDFLTVQGLANFGLMTGVIFAAWKALQTVGKWADTRYVPFSICLAYGVISILVSDVDWKWKQFKTWLPAIFIAIINSLVLYAAVVGTTVAAS